MSQPAFGFPPTLVRVARTGCMTLLSRSLASATAVPHCTSTRRAPAYGPGRASGIVVATSRCAARAREPKGKMVGQLPLIYFNQITASLETNDFVEGLLTNNGLSVIYG